MRTSSYGAGAAALMLAASALSVTPADARNRTGAFLGGLAAGAIVGGIVAGSAGPVYAAPPPPVYYAPAPVYGPPPGGDVDAYCFSRYRSYDPVSGTYMGYDGIRRPCP